MIPQTGQPHVSSTRANAAGQRSPSGHQLAVSPLAPNTSGAHTIAQRSDSCGLRAGVSAHLMLSPRRLRDTCSASTGERCPHGTRPPSPPTGAGRGPVDIWGLTQLENAPGTATMVPSSRQTDNPHPLGGRLNSNGLLGGRHRPPELKHAFQPTLVCHRGIHRSGRNLTTVDVRAGWWTAGPNPG